MVETKDTITEEPENYEERHKEPAYQEGECEKCGNYAQLYDVEGRLLCEECKDEEGATSESDAEEG